MHPPSSILRVFQIPPSLLVPLVRSLWPFLGDGVERAVSSPKQAVLRQFSTKFCWKRFDRRSKVWGLSMTFISLSVLLEAVMMLSSTQTKMTQFLLLRNNPERETQVSTIVILWYVCLHSCSKYYLEVN